MPTNVSLAHAVTHPEPELVFAIVAPTGTDVGSFESRFVDLLKQFGYITKVWRLSDVAQRLHTEELGVTIDLAPEYSRIDSLMTLGNRLRESAERGDFLALHAIAEISNSRSRSEGSAEPLARTVHLLRSLKHPDEVETLRRVYGPGFFLVGIHSTETQRLEYLGWKGVSQADAKRLFERDQNEDEPFGQHMRDTFTLSDVFLQLGKYDQLARFLDLVFGQPFCTPTQEEHAMFLAYAASLRSAQLARQVGAVVVSEEGDVIATGANDVPAFGGGLYWTGDASTDHRDHNEGVDSNDREIARIIDDVTDRLAPSLREDVPVEHVKTILRRGRVSDLTEYGRVVHAEMEALLACARTGVSAKRGTLFTTTFPCHNCAKHIVAAGISRVIYVEPYPKSQALFLHSDSITLDENDTKKVRFLPFVGVAARRYFDLFSMRLSSGLQLIRKKDGKPIHWDRSSALPRLRMSPWSYMERERIAIEQIETAVEKIDAPARSVGDDKTESK